MRYLNIRLARKEDNFRLFMEFNRGMIVHMTQGIEDLCGYKDRSVAVTIDIDWFKLVPFILSSR